MNLKAGRSDCWNAPENVESRATANPVARLTLLSADRLCDFPPIRLSGSAAGALPRPGLAGPAARLAKGTFRLLTNSHGSSARLTPASLFIPSGGRSPEKICRLNTENPCQPVHNVNAGSVDASLQRADVSTVDLSAVRQLLLRQAFRPPEFPQIDCQYLSYFHGRESTVLKSISPRSILDKHVFTGGLDWPQGPFSPPSGRPSNVGRNDWPQSS